MLSNSEWRALYDQYGESANAFQYRPGRSVFNELLGDPSLGFFSFFFFCVFVKTRTHICVGLIQDAPIKRDISVSLQNLYTGTIKKVNV